MARVSRSMQEMVPSVRASRRRSMQEMVPTAVPAGSEVARGNFRVAVGVPTQRSRSAEVNSRSRSVTASWSSGEPGSPEQALTPERRCSVTDTYVPLPGHQATADEADWDDYVYEGEPWTPTRAQGELPQGNCRQFQGAMAPVGLLKRMLGNGQMCTCGQPKHAACHHIPHVCLVCGNEFTAAENTSRSCMRHPMDKIRIVGSHAHSEHKYNTYIWECCPDKPHRCSSEQMFMEKKIPHGYHI